MTRPSITSTRSTGDRILAAASGLFARYGYNGISTRDIASRADVNEVTIYRRYSSKRDLYHAVLESELQQIHLRGDSLAWLAEAQDGRTALDRAFQVIVTTFAEKPNLLRLVQYSVLELSDDLDQLLHKHLGELIAALVNHLTPWVNNGEVRCSNANVLVLMLLTIASSYPAIYRVFSGDISTPETMLRAYTDFCACTGN